MKNTNQNWQARAAAMWQAADAMTVDGFIAAVDPLADEWPADDATALPTFHSRKRGGIGGTSLELNAGRR